MGADFNLRGLQVGIETFDERVSQYVTVVVERRATIAQGAMKTGARWRDRTGNARQGLRAVPGNEGTKWWIDLFHTMPYGIWLEVRWSGRYAIIRPTMQSQGQALMNNLAGLFDRLRGV